MTSSKLLVETDVPRFEKTGPCWICGASGRRFSHDGIFELSIYRDQDPELAAYTGKRVAMVRCDRCGFTQPEQVPALERYFERLYDQRWSADWVAAEFESPAKSRIFDSVLDGLESRLAVPRRALLDIGAHVGKFMSMADARGWRAEGLELNPTTAAYARERTGRVVHERPLEWIQQWGPRFDAVTMIDVLEHIPRPLEALQSVAAAIVPGGWIAIKVPCGPNQLRKERLRKALGRAAHVSVSDNLVHVSHFTPASLRQALALSGFSQIELSVGAPERVLGTGTRVAAANALRTCLYHAARALGGARSPLAFNLQAYACRSGTTERAA